MIFFSSKIIKNLVFWLTLDFLCAETEMLHNENTMVAFSHHILGLNIFQVNNTLTMHLAEEELNANVSILGEEKNTF